MSVTSPSPAGGALAEDPDRDEPLAAQEHSDTIDNLHYPLRTRLPANGNYVARDLRVYRDRSDPRAFRAPDVLVVIGVPDRVRQEYVISEEGKPPDLVIEVLSQSSVQNGDLTDKVDWYEAAGVSEYLIVDPLGHFAQQPRLQLWRLRAGAPRRRRLPDEDGILPSRVVPFAWTVREGWVRVIDLENGDLFPTVWELEPRLRLALLAQEEAEVRQRMEQAARRDAEAHAAMEQAAREAAEAARKAEQAARQAAEAARQAAEARAAALESELEQLRRQADNGHTQ